MGGIVKRVLTQVLILATIAIWIVYDIVVYAYWGNPATESATIWRWAYYSPGFSFACGVLMGHFFFQMKAPTAFTTDVDLSRMKS